MSYIEDVARGTLQETYADLVKARRALLPVAGVLALIHLLTVHPYLETSREIADVEGAMAANDGLLTRIKPEMDQLRDATMGQSAFSKAVTSSSASSNLRAGGVSIQTGIFRSAASARYRPRRKAGTATKRASSGFSTISDRKSS